MKKRLVQALLLSAMMVSLSVSSVVPEKGHDEIIETDVAAQTETTNYKRNNKLFINKKESGMLYKSIEYKSDSLFRLILLDRKSRREHQELEKLTLSMESELKLIESIENKEEYFIAYKSIIARYPQITQEYETIYDAFTEEDLSLLFKVVQAEIGDYSFEQPLKEGDKLIFEDMAIYSMVKNNTFNGMPLPVIALQEKDGECRIVKQFGYDTFKDRL